MRRRWLSLLLYLQVCLCALAVSSLAVSNAPAETLRVNEAATRISLAAGQSKISLAVENHAARATLARITLELLDPLDKVVARTHRRETLKPGASVVAAFLPITNAQRPGEDFKQLIWYRLRYEIAPAVGTNDAGSVDIPPVQGLISLSEITTDLFELNVSAARKANPGQIYSVRVRATHPLSSRPVGGVKVAGEVSFDDGDDETRSLKLSGTTGKDGYVTLDFELPSRLTDDEGEIEVTARRGDVVKTASDDFSLTGTTRILLTSDKPLYQPGQTLHLRALLLNHATRRALADAQATLEIEDPEGTTVFTAPLKTSRFGIASVDWPIADNTRLGDYSIKVEAEGDDSDESEARLQVKISRYELPNFSVSATPDRTYYLPHESAEVEVRGEYLFGQPLTRGHVRLVRETERAWNYKEQKYDFKEGAKYEGELGSDGRFLARIDLSKEHAEMAPNSWERFSDVSFAAYITDPTTNRTEQRRFRLRLSKEPIHIYITQGNYRQAAGLPLVFYVSTSYADGTPAAGCEVKIAHTSAKRESDRTPRTVKTNAFGVAKIVGAKLSEAEVDDHKATLSFSAHDREGRVGTHVESLWMYSNDTPVIRVETDKTIHRTGENIKARISASKEVAKIFVDVISDNRIVATQTVKLHGGRAELELPYRPEFQNRVTLAAYTTEFPDSEYDEYARGTRTVVYPRNRELKFDVRMSQASYQPGEEATAGVRVRNAAGKNVESALGVVVFDKAVEERARTEQDFGSGYGFSSYFYRFWYGPEAIGGISARDIERLNPARALPAGLDTVAELLLQRDDESYRPNFFGSSNYSTNQAHVFAPLAAAGFKATTDALTAHDKQTGAHPANEADLRRVLAAADIALDSLLDPWGRPYRPVFSIEREFDVLTFNSAGADKQHGTEDDWQAARFAWLYFRQTGEIINRALVNYHKRTGGYVRDFPTLRGELNRAGLDLDNLRDRWGKPYEFTFGVNGTNYTLGIVSGGPDGRLTPTEINPHSMSDNFNVWTAWTDYFAETRAQIDTALAAYLNVTRSFPHDEAALQETLRRVQLDLGSLTDPWGHPYYTTFHKETRYVDRTVTESSGNTGGRQQQSAQRTSLIPVTRQLEFVSLSSAGADGQIGSYDDFKVAEFSHIISDQSAHDKKPQAAPAVTTFSGETGAISGVVVDPTGAVIAGAVVTATHQQETERTFETTTGEEGNFLLRNLPAGLYTVRVDSQSFIRGVVTDVQVFSATLATVNFTLNVGSVTETVEVTSGGQSIINSTENSITVSGHSVEMLPKGRNFISLLKKKEDAQATQQPPIQTPRLRKDFPETLHWQPAVETDARGRTDIRFKLADNITTWKMSIIGSTETGELGTVEQEIRAFQPFFVEHDPPRILTEGDEISLPVVLRNYLDRAQPVALDIKPEDWFTLLGPAHKQANVAAGDASRETFDFRAIASVKAGIQRITAIGSDASDQIEKPIHVHPDGEERAETATKILHDASVLEVNLPAAAIPRSARSELKIYPNLLGHAIEGVEAIMSRPYGCAEQTISSTYPSLLVLRYYRHASTTGDANAKQPPVAAKAARYVREGYERLLSYRSESGGFSYWGRGESDLALTAYAVRFLTDAREFTQVDESVLMGARDWLVRQQSANGSWTAHEYGNTSDTRRTAMLTAYVARILARQEPTGKAQPSGQTKSAASAISLRRALDYLAPRTEESDEPYLLAAYTLAAIDGGESPDKITRAVKRLRSLAHDEAGGAYWSQETNTPFYGWGQAGRIETTALVVQALTKANDDGAGTKDEKTAILVSAPASPPSQLSSPELVNRGLLFLLKNKDRYGVWLSTQATVNVLDALDMLSPARATGDWRGEKVSTVAERIASQQAEVFVNGQSAGLFTLPASHEPANPISFDISRLIAPGNNRVEIKRGTGASLVAATAQLVTTYYLPWAATAAADGTHVRAQDSRALRLAVSYDRTTAATGDTVTCRVEAERIGHRGYGMLLAEIGLPPGADVDRASLELAMKESGWEFSQYDMLPDRLIVYLWPRAGGTKFNFTFRPRFGLNAKTAASLVYDYYNPEARALLAPTKFRVNEQPKPAPQQAKKE